MLSVALSVELINALVSLRVALSVELSVELINAFVSLRVALSAELINALVSLRVALSVALSVGLSVGVFKQPDNANAVNITIIPNAIILLNFTVLNHICF